MKADTRDRRRLMSSLVSVASAMILAVVLLPSPADAGSGHWVSLVPVPTAGGVEGLTAGRTSKTLIVAAYGFDSSLGRDTLRTRLYHIDTNSWTQGAFAPQPARSEEGSAVYAGDFYVVGGRGPAGPLADLVRYHPATNTWNVLASMPTPRAGVGVTITGDSIWAIGGRSGPSGPCSGGETAAVERYDISGGVWHHKPPLPVALSDVGAMSYAGKIYVFGGCTQATGITSAAFVFDTATQTWSPIAALPRPTAAFYSLAHNGQGGIYLFGGEAPGGRTRGSTVLYDATTNTYSSGPSMLTPRAEMGVAYGGGRFYTIGGATPCCGASSNANEVLIL
jgi:N-acetylneuraminic acid mutarotase